MVLSRIFSAWAKSEPGLISTVASGIEAISNTLELKVALVANWAS